MTNVSQLTEDEKSLLGNRSGIKTFGNDDTICHHHQKLQFDKFEFLQRSCCDIFHMHKVPIKSSLRTVSLEQALTIQNITGLHVKAGWKLCPKCLIKSKEKPTSSESEDNEFVPLSHKIDTLNQSISCLPDVSPVKIAKVSSRDRLSYSKRKLKQIVHSSQQVFADCSEVPMEVISDSAEQAKNQPSKAEADIDYLVEALKQKLDLTTNRQQQISLLTLSPKSWTIEKVATEFGVTQYTVRQARTLQKEKGILPEVVPARGKPLNDETVRLVKDLYCSDDISRIMPGAKDFVSVREGDKRIHKQRRLLLLNLNELHSQFKARYPAVKIGLSKFCELRPKECVTVGARGTHSVCVCTIHQNVKLMLADLPANGITQLTYQDLLQKLVCSADNKNCMLHSCDRCPGPANVSQYLLDVCNANDDSIEVVTYKQWETTDRTTLHTHVKPLPEYIEILVQKLEKLASHHFIARNQADYLRSLKSRLTDQEAIILLDFAENYSFVVQDAAQGFHWDNSQCTLHPVVVYSVEEQSLKCTSLCIVSNGMHHDTVAVHTFQQKVTSYIKQVMPSVTKIYYFSDGAASQYKNFKNFSNLTMHFEDFGISAEWHFFATSHGKSPCDGIGGTVKREVARASLQATTTGFILTPTDLYQWCQKHISGISFIWVSHEEIEAHGQELAERFRCAQKVPGTRENHSFIPGVNGLQVSRISGDQTDYVCRSDTSGIEVLSVSVTPGCYVSCLYDGQWWIGSIRSVSEENADYEVVFMHPHGPSRYYRWPQREDICWVPHAHVLCKITAPTTATGRSYQISTEDHQAIDASYRKAANKQ